MYPPDLARLAELTTKVREERAQPWERDEFMKILYDRGRLTEEQWGLYQGGKYANDVVRTALLVAGLLLVVYLIGQMSK